MEGKSKASSEVLSQSRQISIKYKCVFLTETAGFIIMERIKNLVNCRKRRQVVTTLDWISGVEDEEDRELLCTKLVTNTASILTAFWNTIKLFILNILNYQTSANQPPANVLIPHHLQSKLSTESDVSFSILEEFDTKLIC